ncbi:hypothetical protein B0O99DRAFT_568327 [Bisporella sp. PMI_857]|nr:hypothetical protein B0O99DRAFT_568327 [Bisporella sp. PMI_857]
MPAHIFITGANRGIGKGLVGEYLSRPNNVVVAAVRDPSHPTSQSLNSLPVGSGSSLIVLPLLGIGASDSFALDAVSILKSKYSITNLDIVIVNAGISNYYGSALETPFDTTREHFNVNTVGSLAVFQAVQPLLAAAEVNGTPKFVTLTSTVGSIGEMDNIPLKAAAYGASKAALNYITRKIHFENPGIIAFPISPGWVKTEMGNYGAVVHGLPEAPVTIDESVKGITSQIDGATRERSSGVLHSFEGDRPSW